MTYAHGSVRMIRIQAKASAQKRAIRILWITGLACTPRPGHLAQARPDSAWACQNRTQAAQPGQGMAQHQAKGETVKTGKIWELGGLGGLKRFLESITTRAGGRALSFKNRDNPPNAPSLIACCA